MRRLRLCLGVRLEEEDLQSTMPHEPSRPIYLYTKFNWGLVFLLRILCHEPTKFLLKTKEEKEEEEDYVIDFDFVIYLCFRNVRIRSVLHFAGS